MKAGEDYALHYGAAERLLAEAEQADGTLRAQHLVAVAQVHATLAAAAAAL